MKAEFMQTFTTRLRFWRALGVNGSIPGIHALDTTNIQPLPHAKH